MFSSLIFHIQIYFYLPFLGALITNLCLFLRPSQAVNHKTTTPPPPPNESPSYLSATKTTFVFAPPPRMPLFASTAVLRVEGRFSSLIWKETIWRNKCEDGFKNRQELRPLLYLLIGNDSKLPFSGGKSNKHVPFQNYLSKKGLFSN